MSITALLIITLISLITFTGLCVWMCVTVSRACDDLDKARREYEDDLFAWKGRDE